MFAVVAFRARPWHPARGRIRGRLRLAPCHLEKGVHIRGNRAHGRSKQGRVLPVPPVQGTGRGGARDTSRSKVAELLVDQVKVWWIRRVGGSNRHLQLVLLAHQSARPLHHHGRQWVNVHNGVDQTVPNGPVPGLPGQCRSLRPRIGKVANASAATLAALRRGEPRRVRAPSATTATIVETDRIGPTLTNTFDFSAYLQVVTSIYDNDDLNAIRAQTRRFVEEEVLPNA